jgi:hypothetical protein
MRLVANAGCTLEYDVIDGIYDGMVLAPDGYTLDGDLTAMVCVSHDAPSFWEQVAETMQERVTGLVPGEGE